MSTAEVVVSGLVQLFWLWRIGSGFWSTYSVSELVTPESAEAWVKTAVTFAAMLTSATLQFAPRASYPRLSLANRLLTIPSQAYSLYLLHKYIGDTLDSRKVNIFLYIMTFLLVLETLYLLSVDWNRIDW